VTDTYEYWANKLKGLRFQTQAFIDGKFVDSVSGKTFKSICPSDGSVLAEIAECDKADVDLAVAAGKRAFERGIWANMSPHERKKRLAKFADLIETHQEELALIDSIEAGKPITDTINVDAPRSARYIRWYAEAIDKVYGEVAPTVRNTTAIMKRVPLGVIGAVVPWNHPLFMAAWKIGPILATGNSLVLKPAEQSSLSALRLAELAAEADIPEGVFNVVPGFGETAGKAIGLHNDVAAVAFTGSTDVGRYFMQYSGQSNLKRISLECGGKSPLIILKDVEDIDEAAKHAAWAIFHNQGQACDAASRLIVEKEIKEEFVQRVLKHTQQIKVGHPLDPTSGMGPIVEERQMERVLQYIEVGKADGAQLIHGGKRIAGNPGYYVEPTIFDGVTNNMRIAQEEIFGPVLSIIEANDFEHALSLANDSIYGLAAGIYTGNVNKVFEAYDRVNAGVFWVNSYGNGDVSTPFGGFKLSGSGRDKSLHAMENYTDIKLAWIDHKFQTK